jgi:hypothetical protein
MDDTRLDGGAAVSVLMPDEPLGAFSMLSVLMP